MDGKLIVLGCGGSAGVPTIGNWWGNCDPAEPRNIRTRPSVAIQTQTTLVIIDTSPDFRDQMNREKLGCPDAIIITHDHADHVNGLDELRTLQRLHKKKFPTYASADTLAKLHRRVDYMFETKENGFYPAVCDPVPVVTPTPITVGDITIQPFDQEHGSITSLGLKIGNIGYSTDVKKLDEKAINILSGIDVWIVDAAGHHDRSNKVHMCIDEVVEMNAKIGAKKVYLTHLPPTMDYRTLLKELPPGFAPAHDGLVVEFTG